MTPLFSSSADPAQDRHQHPRAIAITSSSSSLSHHSSVSTTTTGAATTPTSTAASSCSTPLPSPTSTAVTSLRSTSFSSSSPRRPTNSPSSITSSSTLFDYLFKLVLVGDTGVGKSCLLTRFADDGFCDHMTATIGVDFRIRSMTVCGKQTKLQIWDSAGQERFRSLTSSYYRGAHAVAVVFDLSCYDSIESVTNTWMDEIDQHCNDKRKHVNKILIGNKCDLTKDRQVSYEHAQETAARLGMSYIETSAKTAHNVYQAFEQVVRDILQSDACSATALATPKGNNGVRRRNGKGKDDGRDREKGKGKQGNNAHGEEEDEEDDEDEEVSQDRDTTDPDDASIIRISDIIHTGGGQPKSQRCC